MALALTRSCIAFEARSCQNTTEFLISQLQTLTSTSSAATMATLLMNAPWSAHLAAPDEQVDLRRVLGQVHRLLHRRVATAHHGQWLILSTTIDQLTLSILLENHCHHDRHADDRHSLSVLLTLYIGAAPSQMAHAVMPLDQYLSSLGRNRRLAAAPDAHDTTHQTLSHDCRQSSDESPPRMGLRVPVARISELASTTWSDDVLSRNGLRHPNMVE